jgi:hypothetical protein
MRDEMESNDTKYVRIESRDLEELKNLLLEFCCGTTLLGMSKKEATGAVGPPRNDCQSKHSVFNEGAF